MFRAGGLQVRNRTSIEVTDDVVIGRMRRVEELRIIPVVRLSGTCRAGSGFLAATPLCLLVNDGRSECIIPLTGGGETEHLRSIVDDLREEIEREMRKKTSERT